MQVGLLVPAVVRAGVPMLIVPFAFDQPDNAAHAARLGGSRTVPRAKYQARRVAKELNALLEKHNYAERARAVGQQLRAENGAALACDLLEAVISGPGTAAAASEELLHASGD